MNLLYSVTGCCLGLLAMLFFTPFNIDFTMFLGYKGHNYRNEHKISAESLASSVWCNKRLDGTLVCYFKNLYYLPQFKGHLLFLLNEFSIVSGVESAESLKRLSLSTVQNHSEVYLKVVLVKSSEFLQGQDFSSLETDRTTFIMKRFKSDNIMHVIHDDLLPLFITFKELCHGNIYLCVSSHRLLFLDDSDEGPYFEWYLHFSTHMPILLTKAKNPFCIKNSVIGFSNSSIWYQYGFKNTQGPLLNKHFDGFMLNEFTEFMKNKFGLIDDEIESKNSVKVSFLSRKINRKILNENFIEENIKEIFQSVHKKPVNIYNLDLSANNSKSIIYFLRNSKYLVGMHGSAMILAIFMRPGSQIIELFPFGIQPEIVSPLRALCKNRNVFYDYKSWVNTNESNTKTHPEYPPLLGGLLHLESTQREVIMNTKEVPPVECCHNTVYLFRMFQDTIVDDSFYHMFYNAVSYHNILNEKSVLEKKHEFVIDRWYFPPPIFNLTCKCRSTDGTLTLKWHHPFNSTGIIFNIAISNGINAVTELTHFSLKISECRSSLMGSAQNYVSVWVKTVQDYRESIDSYTQCSNAV